MSLFKNPRFWFVAGIVTAVSAYILRSTSIIWLTIFYIMSSSAFGLSVRTYLDKCEFSDAYMDSEWQPTNESKFVTRAPIILWN